MSCSPFLSLSLQCNWDEGEWIVSRKNIESFIPLSQGVTYDTGGADIKAGGVMAGMSRWAFWLVFSTGFT